MSESAAGKQAGAAPAPHDPKAFVKILGTVVSALGGMAALFLALGYLIVQSYAASIRLYGIADFPMQFYKEATVSFLSGTLGFYSGMPYLIAVAGLVVGLPLLYCVSPARVALTRHISQQRGDFIAACGVFVILVLTWKIAAFREGVWGLSAARAMLVREALLYVLALPGLLACLLYLVFSFRGLGHQVLTQSGYGVVLLLFVLLLASIPIGYGSAVFDVIVFPVETVTFDKEKVPEEIKSSFGGNLKVYYMMGHTSDRELFLDATTNPANPVVIDKDLIQAIEFIGNVNEPVKLRTLFEPSTTAVPEDDQARKITKEDEEWAQYLR